MRFITKIKRKLFLHWQEIMIRKYTKNVFKKNNDYPKTNKKLAIIGGCSITYYIDSGYNWFGTYYNPLGIFNEVYYFQSSKAEIDKLNIGYNFHVHCYEDINDIIKVCNNNKIDVIRGYDSENGLIAISVGKETNIPTIVSIH